MAALTLSTWTRPSTTTMPEYTWDADKNEWLRRNRGLSFDDVVYHLEHGGFLDDVPHPNQQLHPGQRLYIIRIGNYAYEVPFYRDGDVESLRTLYPSRKYTSAYLRNRRQQ